MSVLGKVEVYNSTFHWQIENFSTIDAGIGVRVLSPPFETIHPLDKKLQWQIILYPGGYEEETKEYMGICLSYLSEGEVSASYKFSILDAKHSRVVETTPGKEYSYKKNQNWSIRKFCSKRFVRDETKNVLANDVLQISCTITAKSSTLVSKDYDAEDSARGHFERLFESGDLSDVTFEIGQEKIRLHKAIVTSLSPVFFAMLHNPMKEKENNVVKIVDVDCDVMKELFRYIYVRKVNNIENIAGDLLVAAEEYDVQGLKILCENFLTENLNVNNALEYLELAIKHNTTSLKSKTIEFVVNRLEEFVDRTEFKNMDGSYKNVLFCAIAKNKAKNTI